MKVELLSYEFHLFCFDCGKELGCWQRKYPSGFGVTNVGNEFEVEKCDCIKENAEKDE